MTVSARLAGLALFAVLVVVVAGSLAACATQPGPGPVVYQEVPKPVAVSCVPKDAPAAPKVHTPEELRQVPGGPDRYVLIAADYLKLFAWQLTAAPVLDGCKAAAP